MSKKGIVCEIKKEYCVFLTPDGQFMRGIPLVASVQIGDEAEFNQISVSAKKSSPVKRAFFPIIAAAAIFMLLFATVLNPTQSVHAYVQVEGLETVEFGVDESGQIVEVRPLSGGEIEIETDLYKGKPVESVIVDILTSEDELIVPVAITTVFTGKAEDRKNEAIEQAISNVKNKFDENEVAIYQATVKERNDANEKGVAIQQFLNPKKKEQTKSQKEKKSNTGVKEGHKKNEAQQKSQSQKKSNKENDHKTDGGNKQEQQKKQPPNGKNDQPNNQSDVKEKEQSNQKQKDQEKGQNERTQNNNESKGKGKDNHDQENGSGKENESKENGQGQEKNNHKDKDKDKEKKGNDD